MAHSLADVALTVVVDGRVIWLGPQAVSHVSHVSPVSRVAYAVTHGSWWTCLYCLVDHVVAHRSWIWDLSCRAHLSFEFQ